MFLEQWVHKRINGDKDFRQCVKKGKVETMTREILEAFQFHRLRKTLAYVYKNCTFYKRMFAVEGINPHDLKTLSDLAHLPLTRQEDIRAHPYRFLSISQSSIARVFTLATSGSTGVPKKIFFSDKDIETITDTMAALMKTAITSSGSKASGSKVYILMPDGAPMSQAKLIAKGVEKMGGIPVFGDIKIETEPQMKLIEKAHPLMLMGSAFRVHRLTVEAEEAHDLRKIGIKVILITSEYLSEAMRRNLERSWGVEVYHHYGMTETGLGASIECQFHNGFHFDESNFIIEIVNPETGEVVKDGEEGELVFTNLDREGMPLIRYETGDMTKMLNEPCQCRALSLRRIGKITKRARSIVTIGMGDKIYPSIFEEVIYQFPHIIDYQITIIDNGDGDGIIVEAEVIEGSKIIKDEITEALVKIPLISKNIRKGYLTSPEVNFLGKKGLIRKGRAKRFIIDRRLDKDMSIT
jgi:phenylacetate-CoA ligase